MKYFFEQFVFPFWSNFLLIGFGILLFLSKNVYCENTHIKNDFHRLAVHKAREKQYQESEQLFRQAIAADNKNPVLLCDFAKLFADQNRWTDAEVILKNALLIEPNHRRVLYNLGRTIALQPNRQTEGLRYLKLVLGERESYRELAKIYRSQGHREQAEFAEQQAQLSSQELFSTSSAMSETIPMDEKTKKELCAQVRLELLRLETKEIVVQQDQKTSISDQNSAQPDIAATSKVNVLPKVPAFQSAANIRLSILPKPEENISTAKNSQTAASNVSSKPFVNTAVKMLPQPATEIKATATSVSDTPPKSEYPASKPLAPIAALSDIAVTKNAPEYTVIQKEPFRRLDLSPSEKRQPDDAPSPIHIAPNLIPKEKHEQQTQLIRISANQNTVSQNTSHHSIAKNSSAHSKPVLRDPFQIALDTAKVEKKTAHPPVQTFEKISDYQFTAAQAPNVLKFGILSEEKKPDIPKPIPQKTEQASNAFRPPAVLKFAPTDNSVEYTQKTQQVPKLLPSVAEKKEQKKVEIVYQEPRVSESKLAAVPNNPVPPTVNNELTFQKVVPKVPPESLDIVVGEKLKPNFIEPKLKKIESVPPPIEDTVAVMQKLPSHDSEIKNIKTKDFSSNNPKQFVSNQDPQTEFFGKIARRKPIESVHVPAPVSVNIKSIQSVESEEEPMGFATTRKSSAHNSSVLSLQNPKDSLVDDSIFAESAEETGFARSGQFTNNGSIQ